MQSAGRAARIGRAAVQCGPQRESFPLAPLPRLAQAEGCPTLAFSSSLPLCPPPSAPARPCLLYRSLTRLLYARRPSPGSVLKPHMPNPVSPSSSPTSLPLHGPHEMQTESYNNYYPTSIRISRDLSSTVSHDLVGHDSSSTLFLAEDSNLAEIAPWATPNNGSEPVSVATRASSPHAHSGDAVWTAVLNVKPSPLSRRGVPVWSTFVCSGELPCA